MDDLRFVPLSGIDDAQIIDLMNNPMVVRHLPLRNGEFTAEHCRAFRRAKQQLWDRHGFGPRATRIGGVFAGWGGLQPEHGNADFALVLHPDFWGWGLRIFTRVREQAFIEMKLESITALLPPGRQNSAAVARLGFAEEDPVTVDGVRFRRFRLRNPAC